ncbi:MAG TPA: hypothetical protein PKC89_07555 [Pyrinomonadaceae bacterium]|nr:hypothetical protein [Pyrinomonadaceae bacterium]
MRTITSLKHSYRRLKTLSPTIAAFVIILSFSGGALSQPPESISVRSWKQGSEKITEQTLNIQVTQKNPSFRGEVEGLLGSTYRIVVCPICGKDAVCDSWRVELYKLGRIRGKKGVYESGNLLLPSKPGPGEDYFSKEDLVATFFPDTSKIFLVNGQPWFNGQRAVYPFTAERKIKVEDFFVVLKAKNAEFIENGRREFRSMDISIEFTNK